MRLVDSDKLYDLLREIRMDEVEKYGRRDTKHCCSLSTALYYIQNAPAIDPVKRGKWIYNEFDNVFECSACGGQMVRNVFDYCPWCGAKMRGEEDG